MNVVVVEDYDHLSRVTASMVAAEIRWKPDLVLGLATGWTPLGMYRELVRMFREEGLDFSHVTTFNLDEYYGLSPADPHSYHYYMWDNLFRHVNVRPDLVHIPPGQPADPAAACRAYDEAIDASGGIDVQVLGIGRNGHVGFNEPGGTLQAATHVIELTAATRRANARFFPRLESVPRRAISMGMRPIMQARQVILMAAGREKARAIQATVHGPITTRVPASLLQLHPRCTLVVDRQAAMLLAT